MNPKLRIAPAAQLRQELRVLQGREVLRTTLDVEEAIFIQSLTGRAHEGHGIFAGRRYPDTTEDDVALALRLDPERVRADRQALIDDVARFVDDVIGGAAPRYLVNHDGEPLFGFSPFRTLPVEAANVLGGLFLGGMRDTQELRLEAEQRFGILIGAGKHYFVNTEVMARMGLDGDRLAHGEHADKIDDYRRAGLIVEERPRHDNPVSYMYIRHHRGPGASDDAAIAIAGRRWGLSVGIGVFLADAIDTIEKYVPPDRYADQDADLARMIQGRFPALGFTHEDALEITVLSLGGDGVPDSSLRHLLRVDRAVDQAAIEAHLLYAAGLPYAKMGLAHEKIGTRTFYAEMDRRLSELDQGQPVQEPVA
jgi:hypothetical protein